MTNQLCVIEGDFKFSGFGKAIKQDNFKITDLIESYKFSLKNNTTNIKSTDDISNLLGNNDFVIIHSKDGSDIFSNILQNLSNTYDFDSTLVHNSSVHNNHNNSTILNESKTANQRGSSTNGLFVCFLISDFDQNDTVFTKLEETQSKICSFFNATVNSTVNSTVINTKLTTRFMVFGWPVINYCLENNLNLSNVTDIDRPLYCKIMSGCFVCFTGFKKENKHTVADCIKLVHYMGGSVRKEYNKKITHLIVKSTLSTKYKTAYNIGRCQLLTEDWIIDSWNHRDEVDFDVNNEEFLKKFKLKALYSLSIAFYGFTKEETQHMKEVTIENGGTLITDLNDPQCTHIVINDQEIKKFPNLVKENDPDNGQAILNNSQGINTNGSLTPTSKQSSSVFINMNMSPFTNTRASIVRAEWFWASIQICCRASECLYEFVKPKGETLNGTSLTKLNHHDPPTKRIKLSVDNLLSNEMLNSTVLQNNLNNSNAINSPHYCSNSQRVSGQFTASGKTPTQLLQNMSETKNNVSSSAQFKKNSTNNLLSNIDYESPSVFNAGTINVNTRLSRNRNNMSNNNLSTSASLLDATTDDAMSIDSPFEKQRESTGHGILNSASSNGANSGKKMNKRSQRIIELYETEKRFVSILHTIIHLFKEPIEAPDQVAGPILDQTEVKEIFGNLPPIYEVHCKIKDRLERLANRIFLNEEVMSVGEIYLDNSDALLKTYPPFVNFYEKTKDAIGSCDKLKPRFHAFLKIVQSKPECGRQTLMELFIRPVQRLPSTLLLLDDILRETPKAHRDHELLAKAISSLKEVMTHINEDKRKIENQLAMFVLINDIENCPATLLSSHRSFLKKLDVYEMSNELLKKGAQLTLFLFSDCLEICKPRLKLINAAKSPNAASKQRTPQKCYKHIALFSLNNITKVCDILQNNDDTDLFGILCRLAGEKDKFFSFKVILSNVNTSQQAQSNSICANSLSSVSTANLANSSAYNNTSTMSSNSSTMSSKTYSSIYSSTTNLNSNDEHFQAQLEKKEYIKMLAQGICNVKCITEYENILCTIEAKQLQIDLNESGGSKKLDAVKSYARIINRRVSRAFSFSQDTPNKIKKTISSVFRSPFQNSYSQQSLNEQKASKLTSLASLQLTPTLLETKRKFITLQKSSVPLISPPPSKQNQPKRGSHTIHLLSTRTLKNLRSTTTSTINGIAAAVSSSKSNTQSTSNFSLTTSLASIHKNNSMFKKSRNNKTPNKADLQKNGSYIKSEDEDLSSNTSIKNIDENNVGENNYAEIGEDGDFDGDEDIESDFEDDDEEDSPSKILDDNNYLDINCNNENSSSIITNLFPEGKKKLSLSNSLKSLKKKKENQNLTNKNSISKRHNQNELSESILKNNNQNNVVNILESSQL